MKNLLDLVSFSEFEEEIKKIVEAQTSITNPVAKKCLEDALWLEIMYYKVESYLFETVDMANWGGYSSGGVHYNWQDIRNDFRRNSEENNLIKENFEAINKEDLYSKEAKITLMEGYGWIPEIDKKIIEYKSIAEKRGKELFSLLQDGLTVLPKEIIIPQN